jgi:predicted ATP-grasp superfamily ATP-dependent carboligase
MNKRVTLIFSGYNYRAVIAFCRFATERNVPFYIISSGKNDLINKSDYIKNIITERTKNELTFDDLLYFSSIILEKKDFNKIVILPSTEYINRFLLENREALNDNNIEFGLCEKQVYEMISDKKSFSELCKENSINVPNEFLNGQSDYPIVIKPKTYISKNKEIFSPEIIHNEKDLNLYFNDKNEQDFYIQEYIGGNSIYLLYYIFSDSSYSVYSQENYIQQFNGGSMILAQSSEYHTNKIASKFANLFADVGFKGLVMVEVKLFNDKFYMIEANPRLWGPSQLILDAQMDLFESYAYDNGLTDSLVKLKYRPNIWYYWSGGLNDNMKKELPVTFYNFDAEKLKNKEIEIELNDVYKKNDTLNIYKNENKKND